jgi:hypothetical protein
MEKELSAGHKDMHALAIGACIEQK